MKKFFGLLLLALVLFSCSPPAPQVVQIETADLSLGLGNSSIFRVGPGKDSTGTQVYSFTYVQAAVVFSADGKIVDLEVDELEVSLPNYDGASMPHFSGWPGSPEPNFTNHETAEVDGTTATTEEAVTAEVAAWKTKRERGDSYGMSKNNDWWKQMDGWEAQFIGKTVDEVKAYYAAYTNDRNGRPLNPETKDEAELAKYNKLNKAEKELVADARSSATMSVNDAHGYVLTAIQEAWELRKPFRK
ncbi:hypothetical protein [Oceanispirochaeta sp.]|jgi:hypothetical protein|uniref:hypothetical protein n=1 Tax=Oceanispirochaeta sp. TaxID=2035350 RepID=UPI002619DCBD|nr:hypothetical protein [Oceanispirochaeta sp.]MDA3955647.1 hypothetical protein [Oceanispirochaeta sp.]